MVDLHMPMTGGAVSHLYRWLTADHVPGTARDLHWAWVTLSLSCAVAAGYAVVAVNRFFQVRLGRRGDAKAASACLRNVVLAACAFGYVFLATDMAWSMWRLYDVALLALAFYTWSFVFRTRGLRLVEERLAQVDELERSPDKYRQIAELAPNVVWTATGDGRIDFSNLRWAEYAGRPEGGADDGGWTDALHPDERADVLAWWGAAVAARQAVAREVRLKGTGGYRSFLLRAAPVVRGDAVRWLGACTDIEEQKRRAEATESQARQRTLFLNALNHDLRAPLNIVALNAHLLKTSARDEAEAESAKLIIENATAAGNLLSRALELAKADAQDHNAVEPVRLEEVLGLVVRRFLPAAAQKGLSLRLHAASGPGDVELVTDRQKLERVATNLVDNAIKFTDRGDVTVEFAASEGGAVVRVRDTGPGVPPEHADHLFEEFYQARNAGGGGFGMGLAICRFLARQVGGDVRLAATGPDGSCFEFSLADMSGAREAAGTTPASAGAGHLAV